MAINKIHKIQLGKFICLSGILDPIFCPQIFPKLHFFLWNLRNFVNGRELLVEVFLNVINIIIFISY